MDLYPMARPCLRRIVAQASQARKGKASPALTAQVSADMSAAADSTRPRKKARVAGLRLPVRTLGSTLLCEPMLQPGDKVIKLYRAAEAAANKPLRLLTSAGLYLKAELTVAAAGLRDGDDITAQVALPQIQAADEFWAVLKGDGTVWTARYGGGLRAGPELTDIQQLCAGEDCVYALGADGSVARLDLTQRMGIKQSLGILQGAHDLARAGDAVIATTDGGPVTLVHPARASLYGMPQWFHRAAKIVEADFGIAALTQDDGSVLTRGRLVNPLQHERGVKDIAPPRGRSPPSRRTAPW